LVIFKVPTRPKKRPRVGTIVFPGPRDTHNKRRGRERGIVETREDRGSSDAVQKDVGALFFKLKGASLECSFRGTVPWRGFVGGNVSWTGTGRRKVTEMPGRETNPKKPFLA